MESRRSYAGCPFGSTKPPTSLPLVQGHLQTAGTLLAFFFWGSCMPWADWYTSST